MGKLAKANFRAEIPMPKDVPFFERKEMLKPVEDHEIPEIYRQATFDSKVQTTSLRRLKQFIDDKERSCVVLGGAHGCGKSYAVWALYRYLKHGNFTYKERELVCWASDGYERYADVEHKLKCSVLDSRQFYQDYSRNRYDERGAKLMGEMKHAAVLAIDDLGAEARTTWNQEILEEILDYRYTRRLPMVITTNRSRDVVKNEYSVAVISRLSEWGIYLELPDKSLREHGGFDGKAGTA